MELNFSRLNNLAVEQTQTERNATSPQEPLKTAGHTKASCSAENAPEGLIEAVEGIAEKR